MQFAPKDASLQNGGYADPEKNKGIEVFPKQSQLKPGDLGNYVWLPFSVNAPNGANQNSIGSTLKKNWFPFCPADFERVSRNQLTAVIKTKPDQPEPSQASPVDRGEKIEDFDKQFYFSRRYGQPEPSQASPVDRGEKIEDFDKQFYFSRRYGIEPKTSAIVEGCGFFNYCSENRKNL